MRPIAALAGAAGLALAVAGTPAAQAANVSFGAGAGLGDGSAPATFGLQLDSDPAWNLGPVGFGLGAGLEGDTDGNLWIGGGATVVWPFADHWAVNGGVMAGFYVAGDGDDPDSDLELRTRLGISRSIAFPWRLGVALEQKSTGGFDSGDQTLFLVFSRPIGGWGLQLTAPPLLTTTALRRDHRARTKARSARRKAMQPAVGFRGPRQTWRKIALPRPGTTG